jgi:hypothetical protein
VRPCRPPAAPKPWTPPAAHATAATEEAAVGQGFLPFIGPIVLFIIWDLVVRTGLHQGHPAAAAAGRPERADQRVCGAARC